MFPSGNRAGRVGENSLKEKNCQNAVETGYFAPQGDKGLNVN